MATETRTCKHGNSFYDGCGTCQREYAEFERARTAYEAVSRNINGGSASVLGAVIAMEHPYLTDKLAHAVALGVLSRTYDSLCDASTIFTDEPHPSHDGRLGCGRVIGALRMLAVSRGEDVLAARRFWLDRIYEVPA